MPERCEALSGRVSTCGELLSYEELLHDGASLRLHRSSLCTKGSSSLSGELGADITRSLAGQLLANSITKTAAGRSLPSPLLSNACLLALCGSHILEVEVEIRADISEPLLQRPLLSVRFRERSLLSPVLSAAYDETAETANACPDGCAERATKGGANDCSRRCSRETTSEQSSCALTRGPVFVFRHCYLS